MLSYFLESVSYICTSPIMLLIIWVCAIVGLVLGAIPGLSGGTAIILMLPVTFAMEDRMAIAMLLAFYIGGISGSFIGAILVGIPGSGSSVATVFDGYPMTKKGKAVEALGIGIVASFIGTFFSTIVAMFLTKAVAKIALHMGPWEFFSLCLCAIMMVVGLSKDDIPKGLFSAFLGLMFCCVGTSPLDGSFRFTFGIYQLNSGLTLVCVMMGIFAMSQVLVAHGQGQKTMPDVKLGKDIKGIGVSWKDIIKHKVTIIRSYIDGLWIGFLPGMGSGLSCMVAYGQAKNSKKPPEPDIPYGEGNPDGVWAPEVANNASIGGALIPLIALGIPGDSVGAYLLAAMTIKGLTPGPLILDTNPTFVYTIFVTVLVCAVLILITQFALIRFFPYILKAPYHLLFGTILAMCFTGAYSGSNSMFTLKLLFIFAVIGVAFAYFKIPQTPFVLTFVLANTLETKFRTAVSYSTTGGYLEFFTRPISLILLLVALYSLLNPFLTPLVKKALHLDKKQPVTAGLNTPDVGEGDGT